MSGFLFVVNLTSDDSFSFEWGVTEQVPNGVTHELVRNDQDGVEAMLRWLAYVPATTHLCPARRWSTTATRRRGLLNSKGSPLVSKYTVPTVTNFSCLLLLVFVSL